MSGWKKILFIILIASFSFGVGVRWRLDKIKPVPRPEPGPLLDEPMEPRLDIAGRINTLILGEDNVDGSRRSDTILLATLDIDNRNVRVLSIPRDTRVNIPRYGSQKINHAYSYGKTELVRSTLERFLGIPIHYYIKVDYDNFPKLVDAVGGVDIFVGKAMKYKDVRGGLEINIPEGKQRMNGETALKYVRFRSDPQGDIGRVRRQQQFMKAMMHRMYEPENLVRFAAIADEVRKSVATDISPSMILQLGLFVKELDKEPDKFFFMMLPGEPAVIDKLSYWVADISEVEPFLTADENQLREMIVRSRENKNQLREISSGADPPLEGPNGVKAANAESRDSVPPPQDMAQLIQSFPEAVAVLNGTGKNGVAQSVASRLQKIGVEVTPTGNAKHFDYKSSNVIYPVSSSEKERETAVLLSRVCGISSALTNSNNQATYPSLIVGHDYEKLLKRLENNYAQLN